MRYYHPLAQLSHTKPGMKKYYKIPGFVVAKPKNFWQDIKAKWNKNLAVAAPQISEEDLIKIAIYNEAVRVFNLHPSYQAHVKLLNDYEHTSDKLIRLEQKAINLNEAATASDIDRQTIAFLSTYLISESGLNISKLKMDKLHAKGITNAAHVNVPNYRMMHGNGVGAYTSLPLIDWVWELKQEFNYNPDLPFLAKEKIRLAQHYKVERKLLRKEMDAYVLGIVKLSEELHTASVIFDQTHAEFKLGSLNGFL